MVPVPFRRVLLLLLLGSLLTSVLCLTLSHEYTQMAMFNFRVTDHGTISRYIHPDCHMDLDETGAAWVSVVSSQLSTTKIGPVPVPAGQPYEIQVRTMVVCPSEVSSILVRGYWMLAVSVSGSTIGPSIFFKNIFRVASVPSQRVDHTLGGDYNVISSGFAVDADGDNATIHAEGVVKSQPATVDLSYFLNQTALFGIDPDSRLPMLSKMHGVTFKAPAFPMDLDILNSSVLSALSRYLPDVGPEVCQQHPASCIYLGDSTGSFDTPFVVHD